MIVRISSAVVPQSSVTAYLECVLSSEVPDHEAATGLLSVSVLQRHLVAYVEVMILSLWHSEEALQRFLRCQLIANKTSTQHAAIQLEGRTYELVAFREGKLVNDGR